MQRIFPLAVLAALSLIAVSIDAQIGCGEVLPPDHTCADWQCSRNVTNFCVRGVGKGDACAVDADCYLDLVCDSATKVCATAPSTTKNAAIGYVAAFVSVLCFGSSFVPIKRFKKYAGDGVFCQFCMCFGRFMFGVGLLLTRENKQFYPMAALGGMLWSAGNAISVPIIQCIGMGLGIAIWGTTNMILGWASGKFGWWGVKKEDPARPWLSYLSVVFSFLSIVMFLFVEPHHVKQAVALATGKTLASINGDNRRKKGSMKDDQSMKEGAAPANGSSETTGLLVDPGAAEEDEVIDVASPVLPPPHFPTIADIIGKTKARIIGVGLALTAGALFGMCMDPAQHMMSEYDTLSADTTTKYTPFGFDYAFSFNVGAISFSFFYLSIYLAMAMAGFRPTKNYFDVAQHEKIILPAFANGIIGSCGSAAWFFANQNLGLVVSFPIIAAGPGVVSSLWGVFVFHEIKGHRNYCVLGLAFLTVIAASLTSAYSQLELSSRPRVGSETTQPSRRCVMPTLTAQR